MQRLEHLKKLRDNRRKTPLQLRISLFCVSLLIQNKDKMTPEERIKQLEAELAKRDEKIASLENQLLWLRKKIFGKMSESILL